MAETTIADTPDTSLGGKALSVRQIAWASGLVMAGFFLSRLLGLIRDSVIAGLFGGGRQVDIFFTASRPPDTIFNVVAGGALASAFIPTFVSYLAQDKRDDAWRLASSITNLIVLVLVVISALAAIFPHLVVSYLLAPDFSADEATMTADLMRIMLLTPAIFGVSGLLMGILNSHQRYLLPALAPVMYNIGIIIGAVLFSQSMGIYSLAWGTVLGAGLHLVVQLPGLLRLHPRYRLLIDFHDKAMWEVARLMAPRVLGLAIVQINFWVELVLASGMVDGSISALKRGFFMMMLPEGVIAQSVAIAVFPTFSAQVARGERDALQKTLGQVLRAVLFLSLPATVGLIVLRLPIVRLIYEHGVFTFEESQATAWALLFYGLGLVFHSLLEIVTRAYFAMHDTKTPVIVGGGAMILNVAFCLMLVQIIGQPGSLVMGPFGGLGLALTLSTALETITLLVLIRPRVGGLDGRTMVASLSRAAVASLVMGLALWASLPLIDRAGLLIGILGAIALGGALFWSVAWVIRSEEARLFTAFALRKLRKSPGSQDNQH